MGPRVFPPGGATAPWVPENLPSATVSQQRSLGSPTPAHSTFPREFARLPRAGGIDGSAPFGNAWQRARQGQRSPHPLRTMPPGASRRCRRRSGARLRVSASLSTRNRQGCVLCTEGARRARSAAAVRSGRVVMTQECGRHRHPARGRRADRRVDSRQGLVPSDPRLSVHQEGQAIAGGRGPAVPRRSLLGLRADVRVLRRERPGRISDCGGLPLRDVSTCGWANRHSRT